MTIYVRGEGLQTIGEALQRYSVMAEFEHERTVNTCRFVPLGSSLFGDMPTATGANMSDSGRIISRSHITKVL